MNARCLLAAVLLTVVATTVEAGYKEDIGHTALAAELGGAMPTGLGVAVTQVEAATPTNYMPDAADGELVGKSITNISGVATGISAHATAVGRQFYGTITSIAPAVSNIHVFDAGDWLASGFLHLGGAAEPEIETQRVQNHSWVGSSTASTNAMRRLDYAIDRDGFTAVVGLQNNTDPLPDILAHAYNAITVGRTDGIHGRGPTLFDESGRVKPDVVVPIVGTSFTTPVVGAAAALILQIAQTNAAMSNAASPAAVKAILLAGATKAEFPSWSRTTARPMDAIYGAGELNVYNAYHILAAGEQTASGTATVTRLGWDLDTVAAATNRTYFFDVPASNVMTRLSAVLAWHREIADAPPPVTFDPEPYLPLLELRLYTASNFILQTLVDASTSAVDNVQHIYCRDLPAGQHALCVSSPDGGDYAIAWRSRTALVPQLHPPALATNQAFRLRADVSVDVPHAIDATTNLLNGANWAELTNAVSTNGLLDFVDADSTNLLQRFYRLRPDP